MVKNLPAVQETWVRFLAWEDPLEKGMATHASILAWRILWTEDPGKLQSMGSQGVGYDLATNTRVICFHVCFSYKCKFSIIRNPSSSIFAYSVQAWFWGQKTCPKKWCTKKNQVDVFDLFHKWSTAISHWIITVYLCLLYQTLCFWLGSFSTNNRLKWTIMCQQVGYF